MPTSRISLKETLEFNASFLGYELDKSALDNPSILKQTQKTVAELQISRLLTAEYFTALREKIESARVNLEELAKEDGSQEAKELVEAFKNSMQDPINNFAEAVTDALENGEAFAPQLDNICNGTRELLEKGEELAASPTSNSKKSAEMRQIILLVVAAAAVLFMLYYGVPLETIILVGSAVKYLYENMDKSPLEMTKDLATKIIGDKDLRHNLGEMVIGAGERIVPGLAALGIREIALDADNYLEELGAFDLFNKSKVMLAAMPPKGQTMEDLYNGLFKGFNSILEESLISSPSLKTKFQECLLQMQKNSNGELLLALENLTHEKAHEKNIIGKAQDMVTAFDAINQTLEKFKTIAKQQGELNQSETMILERFTTEMKKYNSEIYAKPVKEFYEASQKTIGGTLANYFGISEETVKSLGSSFKKAEPIFSIGR